MHGLHVCSWCLLSQTYPSGLSMICGPYSLPWVVVSTTGTLLWPHLFCWAHTCQSHITALRLFTVPFLRSLASTSGNKQTNIKSGNNFALDRWFSLQALVTSSGSLICALRSSKQTEFSFTTPITHSMSCHGQGLLSNLVWLKSSPRPERQDHSYLSTSGN